MHRDVAALAWLATWVLATALPASARESFEEDRPFQLTADSVEYERDRGVYVARGDVIVRQERTVLRADWMALNSRTDRGVASGNVIYHDGTDTVYASLADFDLNTLEGVLLDARFESGEEQFRIEGARVVRMGDDLYRVEDGLFTTCRCPDDGRDPWAIRAEETDLEVGGYGTARNSTFEILGVPVLWLPWMLYPVKTERESGILFPEVEIGGGNGFDIGLPLFWAAGDAVNVTLTPRWLLRRGPKGNAEIEYVFGEESEGDVSGTFLVDQDIDSNSTSTPFDDERWATWGREDWFLPWELRGKADFAFVSDNQFPVDFGDLRDRRFDRYIQSQAFVTRAFGRDGRFGVVAGAAFADDMQAPDDLDRDKVLLQRVPTVSGRALSSPLTSPLPWLPLVPSVDWEYSYFDPKKSARGRYPTALVVGDNRFLDTGVDGIPDARERGFPGNPDPNGDDFVTEMDGHYQEGEPLADRGHRLLLRPRLALPLRILDVIELYPEVGWNHVLYESSAQNFEHHAYFTSRVDVSTQLRHRFETVTHLVTPRLGWTFLSDRTPKGEPLYVPPTALPQQRLRQLALDNVVLDTADRVEDVNTLTLSVANRLFGEDGPNGPGLAADVVLSGQYDFEASRFAELFLDGRAYPYRGTTLRFNLGFDPVDAVVEEVLARIAWESRYGHAVTFGYRYLRHVPDLFENYGGDEGRFNDFEDHFERVNQLELGLRLALPWRFTATWDTAASLESHVFLVNRWGLEYQSACLCWSAGVNVARSRDGDGLRVNVVYKFTGMGGGTGYQGPSELSLSQLQFLDDR